jgi:hypothetical protein
MIRARLHRRARILHQKLRNRLYDLWERQGFPDHAEQLRQAQLRCNAGVADVEPELWTADNKYIVKEIEKPSWTFKVRRGPEEVAYSFAPDAPSPEPSELEKYILEQGPGEALNGYQFEDEMMAGCRDQGGEVDGRCPMREVPHQCARTPVTGSPLLEEELA